MALSFALGNGRAGIDYDRPSLDCCVERSLSGPGFKAFGRSARMGGEFNFAAKQSVPFNAARFCAVTAMVPVIRWST